MAKIFYIDVFSFLCFTLFPYLVLNENIHLEISSAKYESFVHNMKEKYYLDKNETIEVWAKVVPFPWQDNRLIPGISDPFLLEFNASCIEEVVSKGVVARNMTVQISQVPRNANMSSVDDKTGNATFHVAVFQRAQDEDLRVKTEIIVGCPTARNLIALKDEEKCPVFDNYTFTIPSGHYRTDIKSPLSLATTSKTLHYNVTTLGCPLKANYYNVFKPTLQLYENGRFLRNVTASYVVFEVNGRTDYSYFATMAQVGCRREAQTFQKMIDDNTALPDLSMAWTPQSYKSCFVSDETQNANLHQPYEILNETGLSALTWDSEGVYVFRATVVDPEYSFCNLTTVFTVHVTATESGREELIPFLVLGTSVFGLMSVIFIVFVTNR